jgi:hypothetical protein
MHRWQKPTRHRKAAIQKHNDKTHVRSPNFQVGDFVLVAEQGKSGVTKLQVEWKGPHRVASVESDYVFVVENLLTQDLKAANATRLIFCKDKKLNVTAELAQAAEHNDHQLYVLSKKLDARYNEQEMFHKLLVAWRSFPVGEATWEQYHAVDVDVPDMVANSWILTRTWTQCARCVLSESSHWEVLCAAKDETSVEFMGRKL